MDEDEVEYEPTPDEILEGPNQTFNEEVRRAQNQILVEKMMNRTFDINEHDLSLRG